MENVVFIIGFMGAGKTTFGKKLAAKLKFSFADLDAVICQQQKANTLKDVINSAGFDAFREIERNALHTIPLNNIVISTGGGTPCYFDNMDWMKAHGKVVFLNIDEGVIYSRLKGTDLSERPLLKDLNDTELKQFIHHKLTERLVFYRQAHIVFDPVHEKLETLAGMLTHTIG